MRAREDSSVVLQRKYYARTADSYDGMHDQLPHELALVHVLGLVRSFGARSLLDTGCGTGWGLRVVRDAFPDIQVRGNDPSRELLDVAIERYGVPPDILDCVGSDPLPYPDESFDVVLAAGVMHHVPRPDRLVNEMLRVARQAIFISDTNIYGAGSVQARVVKGVLARVGLLRPTNRLRRGGHDWFYTEGDGVAWSYSVYDSVKQVRDACRDVLIIPTAEGRARAAVNPLRCSSHALLCGFKSPLPRSPVER